MTNKQKEMMECLADRKEMDLIEVIRIFKREGIKNFAIVRKEYLDTILSLLKQKDKQIDLMAKRLNQAYFDEDKFCKWFEKIMGVQQRMDYGYVVDLIKQYFAGLVEKE